MKGSLISNLGIDAGREKYTNETEQGSKTKTTQIVSSDKWQG